MCVGMCVNVCVRLEYGGGLGPLFSVRESITKAVRNKLIIFLIRELVQNSSNSVFMFPKIALVDILSCLKAGN